ncbi:MAG: DUF2878 domain-containing protein [Hyphomicrobiaceae bacterium]
MTRLTALTLLGFQAVWLVCAWSAAHGRTVQAVAVCCAYAVIAVGLSRDRVPAARLAALSAALGMVVESLLIGLGILIHVTTWPSPLIAPAWLIALWMAYGATVPATRKLLGTRARLKSVLAGAIFGPLAYVAGGALGALTIVQPALPAILTIALLWSATQLLLFSVGRELDARQDRCRG